VSPADDGVRTVYAPAKSISICSGEDFILLRVVEVLYVETALLLAEGCSGKDAFPVGLEGAQGVFEGRL